jgi:5-methylcytosine-specific restriction endonuclease McrA
MLDHKKAMKLWEEVHGKATEAHDRRNRLMYKGSYGQHGSEFGWDIHHKNPKNRGGTDAFDNLQIVHVITHDEIHGR